MHDNKYTVYAVFTSDSQLVDFPELQTILKGEPAAYRQYNHSLSVECSDIERLQDVISFIKGKLDWIGAQYFISHKQNITEAFKTP